MKGKHHEAKTWIPVLALLHLPGTQFSPPKKDLLHSGGGNYCSVIVAYGSLTICQAPFTIYTLGTAQKCSAPESGRRE